MSLTVSIFFLIYLPTLLLFFFSSSSYHLLSSLTSTFLISGSSRPSAFPSVIASPVQFKFPKHQKYTTKEDHGRKERKMVSAVYIPCPLPNGLLEWPPMSEYDCMSRTAFIVCYILTICTLLPLVIFFKLARIKRSQVILNLFLALCFNASTALLLISAPKHPNRALCLLSSAGTMSGTAFVAVAAMDTVLMIWGMLRRASGKKIWLNEYFENILLWLPWAVYVIFLPLNLVYTALNSETLYVSTMTCYADNVITTLTHVVVGISLVAALIFDIWSVIMLLLHRRRVGKTTVAEKDMEWSRRSYESTMTVNLPIISRVLLYSLSTLGGLLAAIILYVKPESHAPAVYQSTCGVSCFFIFGFQPDIWKKIYQFLRFLSTSVFKPQTSTSSPTRTRNQKENAQADTESGQDSSYGPNIDGLSDLVIQSRTCIRSIPLQTMSSGSRRRSESGSSFNNNFSASDDDEYEKMEARIKLEVSSRSGKTMDRSADQVDEGVVTCLAYDVSIQKPVEVEAGVGSSGLMDSIGRSIESEAEVKLSARK